MRWWHVGHIGWVIVLWFRDEANELARRELGVMLSWLKRLIIGKLEAEAQSEIASLIRQEQDKVKVIDPNLLARKVVDYVNLKLGITGV